jgi:hypothetical protein
MQMSTTPLEVTYLRTTSLKPDPRNPRVHCDKQVRQIAQSIESFGFNVPLLIDDEEKVIAGHGRLLAVRKLGWDTVPAIRLSHLTESQRMPEPRPQESVRRGWSERHEYWMAEPDDDNSCVVDACVRASCGRDEQEKCF